MFGIPLILSSQRCRTFSARDDKEHQTLSLRGSFVRAWIAAWSSSLTLCPPSKEGEVMSLLGAVCGGRATAHVFCPQAVWFLIPCFVAERVSPAPSREVVAKHTPEWSWRARYQARRTVWLPLESLGPLLFGLRHHPGGSWIRSFWRLGI